MVSDSWGLPDSPVESRGLLDFDADGFERKQQFKVFKIEVEIGRKLYGEVKNLSRKLAVSRREVKVGGFWNRAG